MKKERIERAVEVIKYAIENDISVWEASVKYGYANTYVKNIKADLQEKYDNGTIEDDLFSFFMDTYKLYETQKKNGSADDDISVVDPKRKKRVYGEQLSMDFNGNVGTVNWQGDSDKFNESFGHENTEDDGTLPRDDEECANDGQCATYNGYPANHIKTLDQLLNRCDIDLDVWEVENYLVNKWDVTSWKHNNLPQTWENFQVKAKIKRKEAQFKAKMAAEIFVDMVKNYTPPIISIDKKEINEDDENNIFEVALFDIHYGKLAWNGETGENYDTAIAKKRFHYAMHKLIRRSLGFSYDRILFPIGNDFFNSDTRENTTSNGTPQDEDLRWQKTFKSGCELIIDGINILKQLGVPVDVIVVPGNHDFERSFYLGEYIDAWFRQDDLVNINNEAKPRKYYCWGRVLLGFTHGRHEAEKSLPMLMAKDKDSKKLWSETDFHEWHLGHFHRKKTKQYTVLDKTGYVDEEDGVIIRYLSSLTGTEEWHFLKGFVGQIKAAEGFIWNDKTGMVGHVNSNYIFEGDVEENNDIETLLDIK